MQNCTKCVKFANMHKSSTFFRCILKKYEFAQKWSIWSSELLDAKWHSAVILSLLSASKQLRGESNWERIHRSIWRTCNCRVSSTFLSFKHERRPLCQCSIKRIFLLANHQRQSVFQNEHKSLATAIVIVIIVPPSDNSSSKFIIHQTLSTLHAPFEVRT